MHRFLLSFRCGQMVGSCVVLGIFGLLSASMLWAQDEEKVSPYDQLWQQVSALLEVREYASALELITDAEADSELKNFRSELKADRKDIEGLQRLATLVQDQAKKMKAGDQLKIGSTEYKVVKVVSDAQGDRLVLESTSSSSKTEKTLAQLDAKSWLSLAQPKLTTSAEDRYVVGMYQASVEHGDRKAAKETLNLAASDKISVTHWTARIEAEAQAIEDEKSTKKAALDDRILGTWRLVIGEGKRQRQLNITFMPRGKTDNRTSTWRKVAESDYVLSAPNGATARLTLRANGEGLRGKMANGAPVHGTRQSKAKRGQPTSAKRD